MNRELPSSAPVTPPSQAFYDPRSRANTLTESSPPLQALQKDVRLPQHYLTPPSEGQGLPATLVVSQSLPVSRRNSNTETLRVGQDLSVIYENSADRYLSPYRILTSVLFTSRIIGSPQGLYLRRGLLRLPKQLSSHRLMATTKLLNFVPKPFLRRMCLGC